MKLLAPAVTALLLLTACAGSPPARFHALTPPPSSSGSGGVARMSVEILPIALPERLTRDEMVVVAAGGGVEVRSQDRWVAPLADEVRQILADALWSRAQAADTYRAPLPPAAAVIPQYRLSLRLDHFEAGPDKAAHLDASWSLRRLPDGAAALCRTSLREDLPDLSSPSIAQGLSQTAARLSAQIAENLARLNNGQAVTCSD